MTDRCGVEECAQIFRSVLQTPLTREIDVAVVIHHLDRMRDRLRSIRASFGDGLHTVAIKANPLIAVLRVCVDEGFGLEAASWEEVQLAVAAGCVPERILFDSPAKTREELSMSLALGVQLNADSFEELQQIEQLLKGRLPMSAIGLRINPLIGPGSIASTSVSTAGNRFGVAITHESEIVDAFSRWRWLRGLHVHVGSQGVSLTQLTQAVQRVCALASVIEVRANRRVECINIGGGLPADRRTPERPQDWFSIDEYARSLRETVPQLFDGSLALATELGRWTQASCGWAVSRVEYLRPGEPDVATIHLGADFLLRSVYCPADWPIDLVALDQHGELKSTPLRPCSVTGPLCFAGDILARDVWLPQLVVGDYLLIRDVGAYSLSMWSRHCNRAMPLVLGVDHGSTRVLKARETTSEVVARWSPPT